MEAWGDDDWHETSAMYILNKHPKLYSYLIWFLKGNVKATRSITLTHVNVRHRGSRTKRARLSAWQILLVCSKIAIVHVAGLVMCCGSAITPNVVQGNIINMMDASGMRGAEEVAYYQIQSTFEESIRFNTRIYVSLGGPHFCFGTQRQRFGSCLLYCLWRCALIFPFT